MNCIRKTDYALQYIHINLQSIIFDLYFVLGDYASVLPTIQLLIAHLSMSHSIQLLNHHKSSHSHSK